MIALMRKAVIIFLGLMFATTICYLIYQAALLDIRIAVMLILIVICMIFLEVTDGS